MWQFNIEEADIPVPSQDATTQPSITSARLELSNNEQIILLEGGNFATDTSMTTKVKFHVGYDSYEGNVISATADRIEVEVSDKVPLAMATGIEVVREEPVNVISGAQPVDPIEFGSNLIAVDAEGDYVFAAGYWRDQVHFINGANQELVAKVSVGTGENNDDGPFDIAPTNNGDRLYVSLANSGRIALVDPVTFRQIDTDPSTEELDFIDLPTGANPLRLTVDLYDQYLYVADGNRGAVYVVNINPTSGEYNQLVEIINVDPAPVGLSQLDIDPEGKRLYVAAPDKRLFGQTVGEESNLIVINIDLADKPGYNEANDRLWHQQIAAIPTGIGETAAPTGIEGVSVTSDPSKIVVTHRFHDSVGIEVVQVENNEPTNFIARVIKIPPVSMAKGRN